MKIKAHYDVVIVGSGLGGLVSAIILAKEGKRVCVLEKNNQYGGNLQTFVRDKSIFDTGVHYIGGLSKGQNLHHYFDYIGIMKDQKLQKMDEQGFDTITFDDDEIEYPYAQGYPNFIETLSSYFPEEKEAIIAYCDKLKETCDNFPLYRLKHSKTDAYDTKLMQLSVKDFLERNNSTTMSNAVYLYNPGSGMNTASSYDTYNTSHTTNYIASCQGFYVNGNTSTDGYAYDISFTNGMRHHTNNDFRSVLPYEGVYLDVVDANGENDPMRLYFDMDAEDGYDNKFDALKLPNGDFNFCTKLSPAKPPPTTIILLGFSV